jgi:hypothetical protein
MGFPAMRRDVHMRRLNARDVLIGLITGVIVKIAHSKINKGGGWNNENGNKRNEGL